MKHLPLVQLGVLAALMSLAPLASRADDYDKKTIITIDQPTEVPGIVLEPGTYVIKLLNSSSNRHIVEIMNEKMDHLYALTFAGAAEITARTKEKVPEGDLPTVKASGQALVPDNAKGSASGSR